MAAWHTEFHVVPKRVLAAAAPPLTADVLESVEWWAGVALPTDYRERLGAAAPPALSASPGLEVWGGEDGNRIEVRSAAGSATSVRARLDVRQPDAKFAAGLLLFVRASNATLVRADGWVTDPTPGGFGIALRGSEAWRVVYDARG
jgi:hypothetical protein